MLAHTARRSAGPSAPAGGADCLSVTLFSASCDKVPLLAPTAASSRSLGPRPPCLRTDRWRSSPRSSSRARPTPRRRRRPTEHRARRHDPNVHLVARRRNAGAQRHRRDLYDDDRAHRAGEARTNNGQVRVTFFADGQSGTATITAFSGGASGKLENLKVGSAGDGQSAADREPAGARHRSGGPANSARVEEVSGGGPLRAFWSRSRRREAQSSHYGHHRRQRQLQRTTLTTSQEAKVTANAAGKTATATVRLSPRTGITITPRPGRSAGVAD